MAEARADLKVGSFVREQAICSARNRWRSGDSIFGCGGVVLFSFSGLESVRSRVMAGPNELREAEQGTEPRLVVTLRLDPEVSWSAWEGAAWLCSPS